MEDKRLIYAAYGSNLLKERFMVYILGGNFRGRTYQGCSDKSEPEDVGWIKVPHRLYFARKSALWDNKGVAFLSCLKEKNPEYHTVVRLWKIRECQFHEVKSQEGSFYNKILDLGEKDGYGIFTLTGCWEQEIEAPSESYLKVISDGLKETTGWTDNEINAYLARFLPI
ncbi:MAG: hypothetical protein QME28_09170 [Candidatus Saccharicenans sp.]|nr:hypothetical protein [Candidatus Saccharicenans sp.]